MGRKSVAERVLARARDDEAFYIVVYDFEVGDSGKIPTRFYKNLVRLEEKLSGRIFQVQKSVYICRGKNAASALYKLVRHYGGEARVFRIAEDSVVI